MHIIVEVMLELSIPPIIAMSEIRGFFYKQSKG